MTGLPAINAGLNAASAVFLGIGYYFIRQKNVRAHRACMLLAFTTSIAFLIGYLTHHAQAGITRFTGTGWARTAYLALLTSHTILATLIVPLALTTLVLALRGRWAAHARWARWTWPVWIYVSITGVVIYVVLYH